VPWVQIVPPDAEATIALDPALSMNGFKSMAVHVSKGSAAIANRGNGGAGLFVEASRSYEGYFFAASELGATVRVSLVNRDTNASLGSTTVRVARNGSFTQQHFSLTTTAGAICTDVIRCSGEFRLEVVGPGRVNFDFVFLQPGLSPSKSNKRTNLKKAPTPTCFYWITKRQGLDDLPRRAQDRTKNTSDNLVAWYWISACISTNQGSGGGTVACLFSKAAQTSSWRWESNRFVSAARSLGIPHGTYETTWLICSVIGVPSLSWQKPTSVSDVCPEPVLAKHPL
jgi:hypothetical protein